MDKCSCLAGCERCTPWLDIYNYEYWFTDRKVKDILTEHRLPQNHRWEPVTAFMFRHHVEFDLGEPPSWAIPRVRDEHLVCVCGKDMFLKTRASIREGYARCLECGHYAGKRWCNCPYCKQRGTQRQGRRGPRANEQVCGKCGKAKPDVSANAFGDCLVCEECFNKYYEAKLSECWGREPVICAAKSLFDSEPERWTFCILRQSYPNLIVIPNAALLSFINLESIQPHLTPIEIDYIYKGRIDLLIVEPANYLPVLAIELDSSWHDNDRVAKNDGMKENILNIASIPLERFRLNGFSTFANIEEALTRRFGGGHA